LYLLLIIYVERNLFFNIFLLNILARLTNLTLLKFNISTWPTHFVDSHTHQAFTVSFVDDHHLTLNRRGRTSTSRHANTRRATTNGCWSTSGTGVKDQHSSR